MKHKVTLIPGDGSGPEVTGAAVRMLDAAGVQIEWETINAGSEAFEKSREYIPKELVESIERTGIALKGPITTPIGGGFASINVTLRKKFELYANVRPIRNLPSLPTRYPAVDLVIVRENTEGQYSGLEHEVVPGVVEALKIITEKASTRIAKFAFTYARREKRHRIHAIHKANIMKMSDGLFLRCCREVAKQYPEITYGEHIIDNTCMQLVMNPYQYDVLVMENLYGGICSSGHRKMNQANRFFSMPLLLLFLLLLGCSKSENSQGTTTAPPQSAPTVVDKATAGPSPELFF